MAESVLTLIVFFPLAGMIAVLFLPSERHNLIRWVSALFTLPPLLLSVWLFVNFDRSEPGFQFVQKVPWIPAYNIDYFVGVDGLSISMVILTALLCFLSIFASWGIDKGVKGYFALFLLLETGMAGVFVSLDFFLFYIFWEVMLLPMYFLIGIWGGSRREYAAIKFFLYTLFGSVLMLLAILALYFTTEPHTFDMTKLIAQSGKYSTTVISFWPFDWLGWGFQHVVWMALFIGFAIKIPAFPFHTWLPDAHVEAPTAVSVVLAGVLLKMGTYGILRINFPMLPAATADFAFYLLGALGAWNIIYGALCAMAQTDLKKLVAYSSVSHMGYVMLGMAAFTPQGINGAVLQMFNHGIITAMLFLLVGVIYDRAHHRNIDGFGGLATVMPIYTGVTALAFFASMGLPGLSGFISEVLVLLGAWERYQVLAMIGASGIILTAGYFLWTMQRVYLGPPNEKYHDLPEINGRELFTLVPLGIIVVVLGVYPHAVLDLISSTLNHLNQIVIPHLS
ncbi:MAG: NADH-quinone oxidoreductase subunit M [Deltaproteobacteria bacterium]|nr:NADH-quinone oxidoreductase subunit M [Deltaproteobacteria bacterium]MCZ6561915.1 NADH-quinone oxidoreductase subunit M [Deltaproteobacteria bacterium]MCZ6621690.1 NADH-quinone oxidoreductase subunit M [Deltaproteobacteria bacterium]